MICGINSTGQRVATKVPTMNNTYCLGESTSGVTLLYVSSQYAPLHRETFDMCYTQTCENGSALCSCYDFSAISNSFVLTAYIELYPDRALENTICYQSIRSLVWRIEVPLGPNLGELYLH